jgi:hypothetical protein
LGVGLKTPTCKTNQTKCQGTEKNYKTGDLTKQTMQAKGNNELVIDTWTILSLNQAGSLRNEKDELKKYEIGIIAL